MNYIERNSKVTAHDATLWHSRLGTFHRYSTQKTRSSIHTTEDKIEQIIGIQLKMVLYSCHHKLYWSQQMRYPPVADIKSLKRFQKLRSFIHFVDNNTYEEGFQRTFQDPAGNWQFTRTMYQNYTWRVPRSRWTDHPHQNKIQNISSPPLSDVRNKF